MPQQKDFKRVVRTRMQKTGESYTTARLHLVKKQSPAEPVAPPQDYAALAKLSDESVKNQKPMPIASARSGAND